MANENGETPKTYYRPIEEPQTNLFDDFEGWQREWKNMPEYVQFETEAYGSVHVRFATEDDMKDFSRLINQEVTRGREAKSIWHPKLRAGSGLHVQPGKRYVDEP